MLENAKLQADNERSLQLLKIQQNMMKERGITVGEVQTLDPTSLGLLDQDEVDADSTSG
jgi:hypothetical protein